MARFDRDRRLPTGTRYLVAGFVTALCLTVATLGLSARELDRVERTIETADQRASSADYLGGAAELLATVHAAHREARQLVGVELAVAGVFLAGLTAIWIAMIGIVRRQSGEIAAHTQRLESANADLDAFAGRVAHELKNALVPVAAAPALLRGSSDHPSRVRSIADRIERASRRSVGVLDALLAFSRAAQSDTDSAPGVLATALESTLEELAPLASEHDVVIEVGPVPEAHVACGQGLLHVVLANLCSNAVKYLDGQPQRRVRILSKLDRGMCRIDVIDTGPGIPTEALGRIFEPFYRVGQSHAPGTGIGLATVRRILDACGGRIEVESTVGRGSRFRVWLPLVDVDDRQARESKITVKTRANARS